MKRITVIISVLLTALLISSCSGGTVVYDRTQDKKDATGRTWTVMVYMCGGREESKSGVYSERLQDMMKVEYPENVNVVVQTGGSTKWNIKGIYSDYLQRFEVSNGKMYLADQAMTANMGSYKTLESFIKWGTSKYKADNYMLVLSGAGGGCIYGMAYDDQNDGDSLTLEEISYAMSESGTNFDIVGFDASLMGGLETASALSTYAHYLVAPQDVMSESGWDYRGVLDYISKHSSADNVEIGKMICDMYYAKCKRDGCEADAAMSLIDMSEVSALCQAFDGMAGDMLLATESLDSLAQLSRTMDRVHIYGGATADEGYSNLIDIGDAAKLLQSNGQKTSEELLRTLNDAVIYRVCGERQKRSNGMSVFYPLGTDSDELGRYMEVSVSNKYKEFLQKTCIECDQYIASPAWDTYNNDMQSLEYKSILDKNTYELNMLGNMNMFKDISINVYKADKKSGNYVFLGRYDKLDGNWEAGIFKDDFNCKMLRLFGKNVTARLVRSYEDYDIYSVPVIMDKQKRYVRIMKKHDKDKYEVLGVWDGTYCVNKDLNKKTGGGIEKIGFFDSVKPALAIYDKDHKKTDYAEGSSVSKLFGGASEKTLDNGGYMLEYELTDIYGIKRHGTAVQGNASGGKIKF